MALPAKHHLESWIDSLESTRNFKYVKALFTKIGHNVHLDGGKLGKMLHQTLHH